MGIDDDVATISHDLKNPLSVIALDVNVLQECLPETIPVQLRRALRRIEQNVAFMDRLVHDLLDCSVIDSTGLVVRTRATELGRLISDVVERCTSARDRSRIFTALPAIAVVMADGPRIERVVANLLLNALKYAPIETHVLIRLESDERVACVSVIDDGPGLGPDELAIVFDKFQRSRTGSAHDGCGLGLFVSRNIIEAHGGRIGVESSGKGSRFFFELPLATEARR